MASMTELKALLITFFKSDLDWIVLVLGCLCIIMIGIVVRKIYLIMISNHLKKQLFQKIIKAYESEKND